MKKLWISMAATVATVILSAATVSNISAVQGKAAATIADNYGAYVVASGELSGGDGLTTYYTKIGDGNGVMTFDLLSVNTFGWFGLICGDSANVNDLDVLKDYVLFGKNTKTTLNLGTLDFAFEAGYTYKATFNASEKKLSLDKKEIGKEDETYVSVFEADTTFETSNVIGMAALSDGRDSSTVIIDNLLISDLKGKTDYVNNTFDGGATVKDDSMKIGCYNTETGETSSVGSVYLHKDMLCTVRFVDESGELLAKQKVCLYGSATAPTAPKKEGYDFVGWSESLCGVRKDMLVYPLYEVSKEEPDDPQDSASESQKPADSGDSSESTSTDQSGTSDGGVLSGCFGVVGSMSILSILTASGAVFLKKRREDK